MNDPAAAYERFHLPLAMWRCQYQLLGGSRRMGAVAVVTSLAIVVGVIGLRRLFWEVPFSTVATRTLNVLGAVQVALVVLGGCNAVYRSMLLDYQSKMIESHRLTPMSNIAVVLGYLFGSTIQITSLYALVLVLGTIISYLGGGKPAQWFYANLFLLNGALTLWAAVVFFDLRPEKPISPAPVLVAIGAMTALTALVPGAGLLLNVYVVLFAVWLLTGALMVPPPALLIVAVVNVAFTLFWLAAAAVKYRRPDLPALNAWRGMLLLVLSVVIGTLGIEAFDRITNTALTSFRDRDLPQIQWIGTLIGAMLLATVPVAGSVRCGVLAARGTALRGSSDRVSPVFVALLSALLVGGVMAALGAQIWTDFVPAFRWRLGWNDPGTAAWMATAAALLLAGIGARGAFGIGHALLHSPRFTAITYFSACWAVPAIADFFRAEASREPIEDLAFSWLMSASPLGAMIAAWTRNGLSVQGLAVQAVVAFLLLFVGVRAERRLRRAAAE